MVDLTLKKTSKTDHIKCTLEVPEHASKLNLCRQEFNLGPEGGRERKCSSRMQYIWLILHVSYRIKV